MALIMPGISSPNKQIKTYFNLLVLYLATENSCPKGEYFWITKMYWQVSKVLGRFFQNLLRKSTHVVSERWMRALSDIRYFDRICSVLYSKICRRAESTEEFWTVLKRTVFSIIGNIELKTFYKCSLPLDLATKFVVDWWIYERKNLRIFVISFDLRRQIKV